MITDLSIYAYITFSIATLFSLVLFYFASNRSLKFIVIIVLWGILHSILAMLGFYENTRTIPPRFFLLVIPMVAIVLSSVFSMNMKNWLSTMNLKMLTYLHMVRIPVELVLYWLFLGKYVPELMTFKGLNFDMLAGITAPIIALLAFRNNKMNKLLLWSWHLFSIILLLNILILAVLSTPTVLQQFAFEQPNIAVMKFPFILLPTIIVPIVLISNMAGFVLLKKDRLT